MKQICAHQLAIEPAGVMRKKVKPLRNARRHVLGQQRQPEYSQGHGHAAANALCRRADSHRTMLPKDTAESSMPAMQISSVCQMVSGAVASGFIS